MATATEAIERIADDTGIPTGSVDRVARVLKQSRPNLWPRSGQGGGSKAAHVEPSHLVNLALGLAVADPITTAPQIVSGYRELTLWDALYMRPECLEDPITEALFHQTGCPITPEGWVLVDGVLSGTLGSACERLIELLASPAEKPLRDRLRIYGLQLELIVDRTPSASIVYRTIGGEEMHFSYLLRQIGLPLSNNFLPPPPVAPLKRQVTIPFALFEALADLWADTLAHHASKGRAIPAQGRNPPIGSEPASGSAGEEAAAPESTKAAGTGIHDGLQTGQPATTSQTASQQEQSTDGREKSQSAGSLADRSPLDEGDRRHDDPEPHSTPQIAA